jgi:hypothetical protein
MTNRPRLLNQQGVVVDSHVIRSTLVEQPAEPTSNGSTLRKAYAFDRDTQLTHRKLSRSAEIGLVFCYTCFDNTICNLRRKTHVVTSVQVEDLLLAADLR